MVNEIMEQLTELELNELERLESIDLSDIYNKIYVRPPYFAFEKIFLYREKLLISKITPEQPVENELSKITMAETGRHLAILGSCAIAKQAIEPAYYLATEATALSPKESKRSKNKKDEIFGISMPILCEGKSVKSACVLINKHKKVLATLDVSYRRFSQKLFNRFYSSFIKETTDTSYNPYKENIDIQVLKIKSHSMLAKFPPLQDIHCAGHFNGSPMLPVAIVMSVLIRASGKLLCNILTCRDINYRVLSAKVCAMYPIAVDDQQQIEINFKCANASEYIFECKTKCLNNNVTNKLDLVLSV